MFRHFKYKGNDKNVNQIVQFIVDYECYTLYVLLNRSSRFSSTPIYAAISSLNEGKYNKAIKVLNFNANEKEELKELIATNIKDNSVAKLLMAKFFWYKDAQLKEDLMAQELYFDKCTLEHIIPQKPKERSNWMTDFSQEFRKEYTYKLGNMTLLTHKINATAKNFDFKVKKQAYKKTRLGMTVEITNKSSINESYILNRQEAIVTAIYEDLRLE